MWQGCSSPEPVQKESEPPVMKRPVDSSKVQPRPKQQPAPASTQRNTAPAVKSGPTQRFTVQADTVDVQQKKRAGTQSVSISVKATAPKRFYTVEVGAFRLQSNVDRHRKELGERFGLPVRVLYDSSIKLTRVCIGAFSSRSRAVEFIQSMRQKHPGEYTDSWVSYWTK